MVETEDPLITQSKANDNKVGIVEVSDLRYDNYLLSQNDQFKFIKTHYSQPNKKNVLTIMDMQWHQ
nr:hypothetical protein [Mycoplasmopsis bovis]